MPKIRGPLTLEEKEMLDSLVYSFNLSFKNMKNHIKVVYFTRITQDNVAELMKLRKEYEKTNQED